MLISQHRLQRIHKREGQSSRRKVICLNCMRSPCSRIYFVRAAAVHTDSKKKKIAIQNAALV